MFLYAYQFVSRTVANPHNLPDSSNLVLNFCLLRRFPTADSATRHVIGWIDCRIISRDQNAGRIHSVRIDNSTFERVEEFKYLGTTLTNQNYIAEEIKSKLRSGNDYYHSVQNL